MDTPHLPHSPAGQPCALCGRITPRAALQRLGDLRPGLANLARGERDGLQDDSLICHNDVKRLRRLYVTALLADEAGELSRLNRAVVNSFGDDTPLASTLEPDAPRTAGDRMADRVAAFGGSWTFILGFVAVIVVWTAVNVTGLLVGPFDPYPFILLNLVLSCVAALQAPIIMMSQRRQEAKDRHRSENDYLVNLKSELEIRQLHEKIDHQIAQQWQRLAEIQEIQMDLLEERGR